MATRQGIDEMRAMFEPVASLVAAYKKRQSETRKFNQSKRERKVFLTNTPARRVLAGAARQKARSLTPLQAHVRAEARKARRVYRDSVKPLVAHARKTFMEVFQETCYTSGKEVKANRSKPPIDRAKVEERQRKRAAFEDQRARSNFIKWVEEAYRRARTDDPTMLPKPERCEPAWFPIRFVLFVQRSGRAMHQELETKREYVKWYEERRGRPYLPSELERLGKEEAAANARRNRERGDADRESEYSSDGEVDHREEWAAHKSLGIERRVHAKKGKSRSTHRGKRVSNKVRAGLGTERGKFRQNLSSVRASNPTIKGRGYGKAPAKGKPKAKREYYRTPEQWSALAGAWMARQVEVSLWDMLQAYSDGVQLDPFARFKGELNHGYSGYLRRFDKSHEVLQTIIITEPIVLKEVEKRYFAAVNERIARLHPPPEPVAPAEEKPAQTGEAVTPSAPPMPDAPAEAKADAEAMGLMETKSDTISVVSRASSKHASAKADLEPSAPPAPSEPSTPPAESSATGEGQMPPAQGQDASVQTEPHPADDEPENVRQPFKAAKRPTARSLFKPEERLSDPALSVYLFDPMGSPFCGFVAIDLAFREAQSEDHYVQLAAEAGDLDGTPQACWAYAHSLGYNLVVHQANDSTGRPGGPCNWTILDQFRYDPSHDTIHLVLHQEHYYLVCANLASNNNIGLPHVPLEPRMSLLLKRLAAATCLWLSALVLLVVFGGPMYTLFVLSAPIVLLSGFDWMPTVVFSQPFYNPNDRDIREHREKHDKKESEDAYSTATVTWAIVWFGKLVWQVAGDGENYVVSLARFYGIYAQAQVAIRMGRDPTTLYDLVHGYRGVNTDPTLPGIYGNTGYIAVLLAQYVSGRVTVEGARTVREAYNANASFTVASEDGIRIVRSNQNRRGYGNRVVKVKSHLSAKIDRPVAVCSLPIFSDRGQIGPGFYPVGDACSLLSAFTMRSMSKDNASLSRDAFVGWSKQFMERFVGELGLMGPEPDERQAYRDAQRGKRSLKLVERVLSNYERYLGGARAKDFMRDSCFVKFENSAKKRACGTWGVKPRLIMTMSDLKAVECSPVLHLIHAFNRTSFSRFQVKEMTPAEMRARIEDATNSWHNVSDYSSFEASIDETIREIENFVMDAGLKRAGWYRTAAAVRRHTRPHKMKTPEVTFSIASRCSGDYWTSFGNGIVNVCIMAYCAHLKGLDPFSINMVAEGDDGIVEAHVPDADVVSALGFSYSSDLSGSRPGDADFLRSRWIRGKRYLDVGRCFSATWLKKGIRLSEPKRKFLVRCVANSLHHLSPGHPVVAALVHRLRQESEGWRHFRGYQRYLDTWSATGFKDFSEPKDYGYRVDESMRKHVAEGANGFAPIAIPTQWELERTLLEDEVPYVANRLDAYPDFESFVASSRLLTRGTYAEETEIRALTAVFGAAPDYQI